MVIIRKFRMSQVEELYLDIPKPQFQQQPLFQCSYPLKYQPQQTYVHQQDQILQAIDEDLLKKTSQLHQAMRNKKLLQFQLIEAKVMKKQNLKRCQQRDKQLNKMPEIEQMLKNDNRNTRHEVRNIERNILEQKKLNSNLKNQIAQVNKSIIKSKHTLQFVSKDDFGNLNMRDDRAKQHGYISIEKLRLQGENGSKAQIIQEIKRMIADLKTKLIEKQRVNQQLQKEYQSLVEQLEKPGIFRNRKKKQQC